MQFYETRNGGDGLCGVFECCESCLGKACANDVVKVKRYSVVGDAAGGGLANVVEEGSEPQFWLGLTLGDHRNGVS